MSSLTEQPLSTQEIRSLVVHCRHSPYDVYIGRASGGAPKSDDYSWGNPFPMNNQSYAERRRVTEEYRNYLYSNPQLVAKARKELKGKVLACWCSPKDCHGHVLAAVANSTGPLPSYCTDDPITSGLTPVLTASEQKMDKPKESKPVAVQVSNVKNQKSQLSFAAVASGNSRGGAITVTTGAAQITAQTQTTAQTFTSSIRPTPSQLAHEDTGVNGGVNSPKKKRNRNRKKTQPSQRAKETSEDTPKNANNVNKVNGQSGHAEENSALSQQSLGTIKVEHSHVVDSVKGGEVPTQSFPLNSLIDIGVNLTSGQFAKDRVKVVQRAHAAGVSPLVVTGLNLEASSKAADLCDTLFSHPRGKDGKGGGVSLPLYFTAGVHPHEAKTWVNPSTASASMKSKSLKAIDKPGGGGGGASQTITKEGIINVKQTLMKLAKHPKCVAIGECGLDFNRNYSTKEDQIQCFKEQLEVACEMNLPLFIHEREAHDALVETVNPFLNQKSSSLSLPPAVIHCFTGNWREAEVYLNMGFYIGLSGFICMEKRGKAFREEVLVRLPLNRILLETDAPFMHPTATGRNRARCEPSHTTHVCNTVAEVLGISAIEVAEQTTQNAKQFFRLP